MGVRVVVWCWGLAWPGEVVLSLLVSRLGGDWLSPGRDVVHIAANPKYVAGPGGFLRVVIIDAVVIGTQHCQIRRIGGTSCFHGMRWCTWA